MGGLTFAVRILKRVLKSQVQCWKHLTHYWTPAFSSRFYWEFAVVVGSCGICAFVGRWSCTSAIKSIVKHSMESSQRRDRQLKALSQQASLIVFILLLAHFRWPWPIGFLSQTIKQWESQRASALNSINLFFCLLLLLPCFHFLLLAGYFQDVLQDLSDLLLKVPTVLLSFSLGNCLISHLVVDKTDDKNRFMRQLGVSVSPDQCPEVHLKHRICIA